VLDLVVVVVMVIKLLLVMMMMTTTTTTMMLTTTMMITHAFSQVVTFFFPVEIELIGAAATFIIFAALTLYSIYFVHKHVPETKGLTLEQIEDLFRTRATQPQAHA
jgi:MFS transporter, SP family, arabinose:H+ symporter